MRLKAGLLTLSLLIAFPCLAQADPDTKWRRLVDTALSKPHKFTHNCDAKTCFDKLQVIGTPYELWTMHDRATGHETHAICINGKDCEHD